MLERHSTTTTLVVAGIPILQDSYGRYNLNTLHQASAAGEAKAPNRWTRLAGTKALQHELAYQLGDQAPDLALETVHGGDRVGTYAHELLAVEYAGWISPAFRLKVNQAFIDLRTGRLVHADTSPVVNPLYQQIIVIAQSLDAHEQRLNAQESRLDNVDAKADLALKSLRRSTVRAYLLRYDLVEQIPSRVARLFDGYLTRYCQAAGLPIYKGRGRERQFLEEVLHHLLPLWLARRGAQLDHF